MPDENESNNQSLKDIEMIADDPEGKLTPILDNFFPIKYFLISRCQHSFQGSILAPILFLLNIITPYFLPPPILSTATVTTTLIAKQCMPIC